MDEHVTIAIIVSFVGIFIGFLLLGIYLAWGKLWAVICLINILVGVIFYIHLTPFTD